MVEAVEDCQCVHLQQELRSRDAERWKLLRLLQDKDEQLASTQSALQLERTDAVRGRVMLVSTTSATKFYQSACVFRAWAGLLQRLRGQRAVKRAKENVADARLRQACGMLVVVLRRPAGRRQSDAMQALWLHSSPQAFEVTNDELETSVDFLADLSDQGPAAAPGGSREDVPEPDQLWDATPRGASPGAAKRPPEKWDASPWPRGFQRRHCPTPLSEASTALPSLPPLLMQSAAASSVSACTGVSASVSSSMLPPLPSPGRRANAGLLPGAAQLALAFSGAGWRRAAWALSGLRRHAGAAAVEAAQRAAELAVASEAESLEAWRRSEEAVATQLRKEQDDGARLHIELLQLQETAHDARLEVEACEEQAAETERAQQQALTNCEELEAQLESKDRWREEAEQRIRRMVSCGEGLERERLRLRSELKEARFMHRSRSEQFETVRCSLEQQEQLAELLKARVHALEHDRSELTARQERDAATRRELAQRQAEEISTLQKEATQARETLRTAARSRGKAERRAAEAARGELAEELGVERTQWAQARLALQAQAAGAQHELVAERRKLRLAEASAVTAEEARLAVQARLAGVHEELSAERGRAQETEAGSQEESRLALARERESGREAVLRMEEQLTQARCREEDLELRLARSEDRLAEASAAAIPGSHGVEHLISRPSTPMPSTPQLQELDVYAELVEQLRGEVARERAGREASAHSLAALRSSYRMLLQRTSGCSTEVSAGAGVKLVTSGGA